MKKLLPNATVTLEGKFNRIVQDTNEKGEVHFNNVPPDTYTVLVQKEGYDDQILPQPITIKKGRNNTHRQEVSLQKTKHENKPIQEIDTRTLIIKTKHEKARVRLISYENKGTYTLITDNKGVACFEEIPFGNYEINIYLEGFEEYSRDILVNSNNRLIREIPCKLQQIIME